MSVSVTFAVKAQQLLEEGNAGEAIQLCKQGLDAYPNYVTAYLILARACIAVGDYIAAEEALERGLQKAPRSSTARTLRKEVQYAMRFKSKSSETANASGSFSSVNGGGLVPSGLQSALEEASTAVSFIDEGRELSTEQAEKTLGNYLRIIETDKTSPEQQSSFRSTNLRLIPGLDFTPLRVESQSPHYVAQQRNSNVPEPPPLAEFAEWQQYQESLRNESAVEVPLEADSAEFLLKPQTGYSRPPLPTPRFSIREIESLPIAAEQTSEQTSDEPNELDSLASRLMQARMPDVKEMLQRPNEIPQYLQDNAGETISDDQLGAGTVIVSETMAKIYEAQGALTQALHAYQTLASEAAAQKNDNKLRFYGEKVHAVQARIHGTV
jgi:tetratricopeptide (TPR) repeat protein